MTENSTFGFTILTLSLITLGGISNIGCGEISKSIELNRVADTKDISCLTELPGFTTLGVNSNSTYLGSKEKHQLEISGTIEGILQDSIHPENVFVQCLQLLDKNSKPEFNSTRIIVKPINSNVNKDIIIELYNDTAYYLTSNVGFPLDSILSKK